MLVPMGIPIALAIAGWMTAGWASAVAGLAVGGLIVVALILGAAVWARRIGSHFEPSDAFTVAPRPPWFRRVCDWTYRRTLS